MSLFTKTRGETEEGFLIDEQKNMTVINKEMSNKKLFIKKLLMTLIVLVVTALIIGFAYAHLSAETISSKEEESATDGSSMGEEYQ